jgi:hypothetical protein
MLRSAALLVADVLALAIYAFGLIAPLTPSEGCPSRVEQAVFVGLPIAVLCGVCYVTRSRAARVIVTLQAVAILAFTTDLMRLQRCLPSFLGG